MKIFIILSSLIGSFFLLSCSSKYKELSDNDFEPPNEFSTHLFNVYKSKADFEAKSMHDWNSAKLYAEKALQAAKGMNIKPEEMDYWKISNNKTNELNKAYENLMIVYNNAVKNSPYHLAIAISSLDCWAEQQEEMWQIWDINKCKDNFINALHEIYAKIEIKNDTDIEKKVTKNSTVSVVTKNHNQKVMQIIYFDFDKSNLSRVSINKIKNFIDKSGKNINKYLVVGHTDTKGVKKYNYELSIERAKKVKEILENLGINSKLIYILGEGENKLNVKTDDNMAHPANRRAEISIIN